MDHKVAANCSGQGRLEETAFGVFTPFCGARRLSDETHALAKRYLSGEIGRTLREASFAIAPEFLASNPTSNQRYAEAVRMIAAQAPLRILPGERLVGAATLKEAAWHQVPLTPFASISHTTLGFEKALRIGYRGIRREVEERIEKGGLDTAGRDLPAD